MSSRIGNSNYKPEATRKGHNRKLLSCQISSEDADTYSRQCVHKLSSSNESLLKWPTLFIKIHKTNKVVCNIHWIIAIVKSSVSPEILAIASHKELTEANFQVPELKYLFTTLYRALRHFQEGVRKGQTICMGLRDGWRHEQIQIIPQILPWAVGFHGIRTLHHYGTYTPLVPCSTIYLISNNPLEVPASSFWTASHLRKVIRAILAFFF